MSVIELCTNVTLYTVTLYPDPAYSCNLEKVIIPWFYKFKTEIFLANIIIGDQRV